MAAAASPKLAAWLQQILAGSRARGLDPRAVRAVAAQEGLSGGVGDSGHAFGPFQLNDAGGVLTGRPGNHRAFAESPAGISWALDQIARVARGLHGEQAVNAIVRRFERPQDPGSEVARALAALGQDGGGAAPPAPSPAGAPAAATMGTAGNPDLRRQAVLALIGQVGQPSPDYQPFLQALQSFRASRTAPAPPLQPAAAAGGMGAGPQLGGSIAELLREGTGGPTHSTGPHVHLATKTAQAMLAALQEGRTLGLSERENPYVDPVDPVHAQGSYHYRRFPGRYNGRALGQATDFSGDPQQMAAFYQWALAHLGNKRR